MGTEVFVRTQQIYSESIKSELTTLEKFVLKCFHPRAIFIEIVGLIWCFYFFWNYDWQLSIGFFALSLAIALFSVLDADPKRLSETLLGKIALLHLHPVNLAVRLVGMALLLYGIWQRSIELGLGGASIIFLGHTFGWEKVDSRLGK